jgi:hypothetical protein
MTFCIDCGNKLWLTNPQHLCSECRECDSEAMDLEDRLEKLFEEIDNEAV